MLINLNDEKVLDLNFINENLKNLEVLLTKHGIFQKAEFKEWFDDFKKVYGENLVTLQLYSVYALIYLIGYLFISKFVLKKKNSAFQIKSSLKLLKNIETEIRSNYKNLDLFVIRYFEPVFSLSEIENLEFFNSLLLEVSEYVFNLNIPPEYYFDYLMQKLISPIIRHKSGEYYTPPFLVKTMIRDSYLFGETVLDPCCGSGNFLVELVKLILSQRETKEKKIGAFNSIYGFDINPISIYMSKINLLYLLENFRAEVMLNLYVFDSLFQVERKFEKKFDLIIGNPPWYTYRDIESIDEQERVKNLAHQFKIKPLPKNLLNLEISTLFFFKANSTFLREKGKIFFVITKGVITGSHTSRFRNFEGLSNIKIWVFDRKVENIFNIDFICLFGQKTSNSSINSNKEIKSYYFNLKCKNDQIEYFKEIELKLEKVDNLIPYEIEKKAGKTYTKKFISKSIVQDLLPIKESYYKPLFHKGADLNPRNLIFVSYKELNNSLVRINPEKRIFKKAKPPWNKKEYKNEVIEKKYIFKIIKSTELVKFYVYNYYNVFLPLSKNDLSFEYKNLDKYAKSFYDKINNLYKRYKKSTTKHKTLMDNLNRWSKLINKRQMSNIKVVYNNSGSILQCAVVLGDYLVTGDLSFYATENLEEAFYLSAILNSNIINKQVKIMKSSRHIFKLPLEIPIEKFDISNDNHQKLVDLGKRGQEMAKVLFNRFIKNNNENLSKFKIQNFLSDKLEAIIAKIDEILIKQFYKS
ncbi:MAG: class I SAM-dependent DNA methyltransferase [Promethearchaeota archaeon]